MTNVLLTPKRRIASNGYLAADMSNRKQLVSPPDSPIDDSEGKYLC